MSGEADEPGEAQPTGAPARACGHCFCPDHKLLRRTASLGAQHERTANDCGL
jgi:hypothetical protein